MVIINSIVQNEIEIKLTIYCVLLFNISLTDRFHLQESFERIHKFPIQNKAISIKCPNCSLFRIGFSLSLSLLFFLLEISYFIYSEVALTCKSHHIKRIYYISNICRVGFIPRKKRERIFSCKSCCDGEKK